MRKLTPEEREAKRAALASATRVEEVHVHDENCGHEVADTQPKRGRKKAEEAPAVEEAPAPVAVEEAPVEEAPVAVEEVAVEGETA